MGGLLTALTSAGVAYIVIGGVAVGAHGVVRATKDLDICPAPERENLERLARVLLDLGARQVGVGGGGFAENEMPFDPASPHDLGQGGNVRLDTRLGALDLMQWIPGIDADHAFEVLRRNAQTAQAFGIEVMVCSLADLRLMKRTAGRPQDLIDLEGLAAAHPEADAGG